MKRFILKVISNSIAFYAAIYLFSSISVNSDFTPILAGMVLAMLNLLLRPLLVLILAPFILLTVGLLTLVINTWMVMLTDKLIPIINIPGFGLSLLVALIIIVFDRITVKLYKTYNIPGTRA